MVTETILKEIEVDDIVDPTFVFDGEDQLYLKTDYG